MKLFDKIKDFTPLDIVLFVIFILYIVVPVDTPLFMIDAVQSPLGILMIFVITLVLFVYVNPILAVLYIFVAYELLRRSQRTAHTIQYQEGKRMEEVAASNVPKQMIKPMTQYKPENIVLKQDSTLEEEVVKKMAPIGHSDPAMYISTSYKPVSEPVGSASMF
jgi:hypothetical protein